MSDIVNETQGTRHKVVLYSWLQYHMAGWEKHTTVPTPTPLPKVSGMMHMPHRMYVQGAKTVLPPPGLPEL